MIAAAAEDRCGGQQQQWQTTTTVENDSTQDWVADYDGEGQEQVARDGRDSRVGMMAVVAEDRGGRQQQQW
jgi:hypothetical protein